MSPEESAQLAEDRRLAAQLAVALDSQLDGFEARANRVWAWLREPASLTVTASQPVDKELPA